MEPPDGLGLGVCVGTGVVGLYVGTGVMGLGWDACSGTVAVEFGQAEYSGAEAVGLR